MKWEDPPPLRTSIVKWEDPPLPDLPFRSFKVLRVVAEKPVLLCEVEVLPEEEDTEEVRGRGDMEEVRVGHGCCYPSRTGMAHRPQDPAAHTSLLLTFP